MCQTVIAEPLTLRGKMTGQEPPNCWIMEQAGQRAVFLTRVFLLRRRVSFFPLAGWKSFMWRPVCPFLSFPPDRDQTSALKEDKTYETARDIFHRFAEDPKMIGMSARILIVSRKI